MDPGMLGEGQLQALHGNISAANYIQNFQVPMTPQHTRNIEGREQVQYSSHNTMETNMHPILMVPEDAYKNMIQFVLPQQQERLQYPQSCHIGVNQSYNESRTGMQQQHNNNDDDPIIPMPFQVKTEVIDDFYNINSQYPNNNSVQDNVQPPNMMNMPANNVPYMYYPQIVPQVGQNKPTMQFNNFVMQEDPQNLVMDRSGSLAVTKVEETKDTDVNGKVLRNNFPFVEKNENDASSLNKVIKYNSKNNMDYSKDELVCYKCLETLSLKCTHKLCPKTYFNGDPGGNKISKFVCTLCTYKCQSAAILKIHVRTHTGEKPFSCSHCDYKSGQKNNVVKHELVHIKEKPFQCQFCDYKCAQKNNLVVHERTHTGYKPFACTFCNYRTVQKPNLVKHMYLHTDKKPFGCDVCSYRCVQKTNLNKHMRRHVNEADAKTPGKQVNKYKCDKCNYKCVQKFSMDKHMHLKHPQDTPEVQQFRDVLQGLNLMKNDKNAENNKPSN